MSVAPNSEQNADDTAVLVSTRSEVMGVWKRHGVAVQTPEGLEGLETSTSLIVIDAHLKRQEWLDTTITAMKTHPAADVLILWDGPDAGLFTTEELIEGGHRIITRLDDAFPCEVPEGQVHELGEPSDDRTSELVTMLGTEASVDTVTALVQAVVSMRCELTKPLWYTGPPTNSQEGYKPGRPPMPSLQWLLTRAGSTPKALKTAEAFWDHLENLPDKPVPPSTLIVGETGVGKTTMARLLHRALYRDDHELRPFVEVSVPTLRGELFNDQFFGHTDDYTGVSTVIGPALQATFGTLFIDEIGDLPLEGQVGLLQFLTTRRARPSGLARDIYLPLHVVAATNRPLVEMVREGSFRQDLFNRFANVITISSLAERLEAPGEVEKVVSALLRSPEINPALRHGPRKGEPAVQGVHQGVFAKVKSLEFRTGNFRELRTLLQGGVLHAIDRRCPILLPEHLPIAPSQAIEGELSGIGIDCDLDSLVAALGGVPVIGCEDLVQLAGRLARPLLRTSDDRLAVMWERVMWVDQEA